MDIEERIAAIEARQRDRKEHDPDCPIRVAEVSNEWGGMYYVPSGPCNCWLADPLS